MGNLKTKAGAFLAVLALAAVAFAGEPTVKDDAGFFSASAVQQAQSQVQQIKQQTGRTIVIESAATLPSELAGKVDGNAQSKEKAYGDYVRQRLTVTGADLYVFINKSPAHIEAFSGPANQSGISGSDRELLVQQMGQQFRSKNFDGGLADFINSAQQTLSKTPGGSVPPAPIPDRRANNDPQPRSSPAPMPNRTESGGLLGGFGCIGLIVIAVVIFIIFRVIGGFLNRGRNTPPQGYGGQGYGGQGYNQQGYNQPGGFGGGGGFGRGMLGGILGGLFGSYIGNQTFGSDSSSSHHTSDTSDPSSSNDTGFSGGPTDTGGSSGVDFGDSGSSGADFGGGSDFGGGDSGGGDSGGSSGSDF